jgi:hypothetical protein
VFVVSSTRPNLSIVSRPFSRKMASIGKLHYSPTSPYVRKVAIMGHVGGLGRVGWREDAFSIEDVAFIQSDS